VAAVAVKISINGYALLNYLIFLKVSLWIVIVSSVLHQQDQKIIYPHYDFKHLTEKYFEIGMKLDDFLIQLVKYCIFLVMLVVYIAGLVAISWYFNSRPKSITDFWLAGRMIGPAALGFSAAASWLTAGGILAVVGYFMLKGMGSIWGFVAPNILALLVIAVLVGKIKSLPAITQPELLKQRYGSAIRLPIALIITVVMILFSVADITGLSLVLQVFYGLDPLYAAAIIAISVSLYVTLGELSAVIWTDVIQFAFLAIFAIEIAFAAVGTVADGGFNTTAISSSELFGNVPGSW